VTYVLEELRRDPEFEFCCVVDSVPGVDALAQAVREAGCLRSLQVLVEVGFEQGRAGCRTVVEALEVARAARAAAPALAFRGVETYEGVIDGYSEDETLERVHDLLDKAVVSPSKENACQRWAIHTWQVLQMTYSGVVTLRR
jgi:D-serine dehydratase